MSAALKAMAEVFQLRSYLEWRGWVEKQGTFVQPLPQHAAVVV